MWTTGVTYIHIMQQTGLQKWYHIVNNLISQYYVDIGRIRFVLIYWLGLLTQATMWIVV